jgi:hypothetical protein
MKLSVFVGMATVVALIAAGTGVAPPEATDIAAEMAEEAVGDALLLADGGITDAQAKANAVSNIALNVTGNVAGQANAAVALAGMVAGGGWESTRDVAYLYYVSADHAADGAATCAFGVEPSQAGLLGFQACAVMLTNALVEA